MKPGHDLELLGCGVAGLLQRGAVLLERLGVEAEEVLAGELAEVDGDRPVAGHRLAVPGQRRDRVHGGVQAGPVLLADVLAAGVDQMVVSSVGAAVDAVEELAVGADAGEVAHVAELGVAHLGAGEPRGADAVAGAAPHLDEVVVLRPHGEHDGAGLGDDEGAVVQRETGCAGDALTVGEQLRPRPRRHWKRTPRRFARSVRAWHMSGSMLAVPKGNGHLA